MIKVFVSLLAFWAFGKSFPVLCEAFKSEVLIGKKIILSVVIVVDIFGVLMAAYFFAIGVEEMHGNEVTPLFGW